MSSNLDTWSLCETEFAVRNNRHYEGLLAIGSGPLQQRASLEEGLRDDPQNVEYLRIMGNVTVEKFRDFKSRVGTYLPGITGPHPTCLDQMLNLPALHGLTVYANGERLDMENGRISQYERRLDLRTGRLSRKFVWKTRHGNTLRVSFERFISAKRRHLMAQRCRVEHAGGPVAELRFIGTLDADVRTNGYDHFKSIDITGEQEPVTIRVRTDGGADVAVAAVMACDRDIRRSVETAERWAGMTGFHVLDSGQSITISKFAALTSDHHARKKPIEAVRRYVWEAVSAGYEKLATESDQVWAERWARTDVVIEGDEKSQLALRASLYHMLRAASEDDRRRAIDAKGAAGEAYCGRFFWDTEIFMLPLFLYTRPEVGKMLAAFRVHSLDGARRNAKRYGYPGARYAWESAASGDENCPGWQYADHEVHVTADVAYGLWHAYLTNPGDAAFLAEIVEVLFETARYWCDRVTYRPETDKYELLMVMGPDEYTPFSRNNAYTNYMARFALRTALDAWSELKTADAEAATSIATRLGVSDADMRHFAEIADRLRFPYDKARKLVLQADDFDSTEPFDADRWWPDRTKRVAACVSQERLYRSKILKQADVVQLMALAPHEFDTDHMRAAYDEYEPLTSHDSSLSKAMHAIVAAWIGRDDEALRWWDESVGLDLEVGEAAEGIHAACAGANWQVAVFGFAGIRSRVQSDVLWIDPHLPRRWKKLRFPFVWDQQPLVITIEHDGVTIEHSGSAALEANIAGATQTLPPGKTTRVALSAGR
ncbi:MAG: glycoside hydrolase family 65 protein [Phycisphaerae bacterium]|nr:glycoside hydrolase family 65 protein [Phycisphaerae bacterium]